MGEARHDGLAVPGRVILAHELPFHIGALAVHPSIRQIERGERHETLEPRVMQVLVALARAGGGIVTRDELIESCWDGRVVGDDSINRVLSRIRRVAADLGGGAFAIETIARVGYRLIPVGTAEEAPHSPPAEQSGGPRIDRRLLLGGAAALAAVAVGATLLWPGLSGRNTPLPEAKSLYDQAVVVGQEDHRQALAYLREAVRLSPDYGEAWGALALAYRSAINNEAPERVAGFDERLREAVRNAELHDPGNADAAAALLPSKSMFGRWSELEPIYRAAIRRHPGHAAGYSLLGTLLMDAGRWMDAVAALQAARSHNDRSAVLRYKLIVALWSAGRISAAEDEIDQAMKLWPQHGAIWQTKIKLLALTGRPRQALAFASDPAATPIDEADGPDYRDRLQFLTALATRSPGDLGQAIEATLRRARRIEHDTLNAALQITALGRVDIALGMVEGLFLGKGEWALQSGGKENFTTHPLFQPHARPLWREPRFARILESVGLEDYWRMSRTLPDYRLGH
jgi:DNA-binding winged helix-turn-helix (wHTH) protein/tetratricopeptide (TPR) repeat protein